MSCVETVGPIRLLIHSRPISNRAKQSKCVLVYVDAGIAEFGWPFAVASTVFDNFSLVRRARNYEWRLKNSSILNVNRCCK